MSKIVMFSMMMAGGLAAAAAARGAQGVPALRMWRWHGGTNWAPNGIDTVYRIDNGYNGYSITVREGSTGESPYVRQFSFAQPGTQRFVFEDAGDGYYAIRNTTPTPSYLQLPDPSYRRQTPITPAEVQAFGRRGGAKTIEMISKQATASQSSDFPGYPASNALDGNPDTFSHTQSAADSWWEMDLGEECTITKVVVVNRRLYGSRLRGCTVRVYDADHVSVWSAPITKVADGSIHTFVVGKDGVKGRYIRVAIEPTGKPYPYLMRSPGKGGDDKKWKIELVDRDGFYKIVSKKNGLCLEAEKNPGPNPRLALNQPIRLSVYRDGVKTMRWNIEPVRDTPPDCLATSQVGWAPLAPKYAVLIRRRRLAKAPPFTVRREDGEVVYRGQSVYWGTMYVRHFYVLDISALRQPGTYVLACDGDGATLYISDDAYVRIRHRGGTDWTRFRDMLDGKGFIGYWGHLDTWWDLGVFQGEKAYWHEADFSKPNGHQGTRRLDRKIEAKYIGGWDHTDLQWSYLQPMCFLMRSLNFSWRLNGMPAADHRAILHEIMYGATYFTRIQNDDGSWPCSTTICNKLTGTVAAIASVLAACHEAVKTEDPVLAETMLTAAKRGFDWVEANPDKWVPVNISYRHGRAEERMMMALELYEATGGDAYKKVAYGMIRQSTITPNGVWARKEGEFAGQSPDDRGSYQAVLTMMHHYDQAPDDIKTIIRREAHALGESITRGNRRTGPFGMLEGHSSGYGQGATFAEWAVFLFHLYRSYGDECGQGYLLAERIADWLLGCNPFATSQVFGCGDVFTVFGWTRAYEIGSLLPGLAALCDKNGLVQPFQLTATKQGYGNGESSAQAGATFIHLMTIRHLLRHSPPRMASFFTQAEQRGARVDLPVGSYKSEHLRALGIDDRSVASLTVPAGFKVTLYDKDAFSGASREITADVMNLADDAWDHRALSIRVDMH